MTIERELEKLLKKIKQDVANVTLEVGSDIAEDSLEECPKDTGALRKSQKIRMNGKEVKKGSKVDNYNTKTELTVGYNTEYALRQHEDLSYNHPYPGTKAKYLTDPFTKHTENYNEKLRESINKSIRSKV